MEKGVLASSAVWSGWTGLGKESWQEGETLLSEAERLLEREQGQSSVE